MFTDSIVKKLSEIKNGAFFNINYFTELPVSASAKKQGVTAIKKVEMVCRKGIDYSNQKYIRYLVSELGKTLTHKLAHGEWDDDNENIINFTDKDGNAKPKVRVYMSTCIADSQNKPINKSKVEYFVNGKVVDYQTLKDLNILRPSFFKEKENDTPSKLSRLNELENKFRADKSLLSTEEQEELLKLSKWAYNKCIEINCEHVISIG